MNFSQKIIELRKDKGFTQKTFAESIGTTDKVVWTYEKGKCEPSLAMLKQIAEVLGVSVGYLIGAEDEGGRPVPQDLTVKEQKILKLFGSLTESEQDKLIADAEFYARRSPGIFGAGQKLG